MSRNYGASNIFAEKELRDYLETRRQTVITSIENERDDYLLNVNDLDYVSYKAAEAKVEPLEIHIDQIYASSSEQMIPAEYFPSSFWVERGSSYKKDVIKFHIPISGNQELIKCAPSSRLVWSMPIQLGRNEFTFEIINFSDDVEKITREKDSNIQSIVKQLSNVTSEVTNYNNSIEIRF